MFQLRNKVIVTKNKVNNIDEIFGNKIYLLFAHKGVVGERKGI